MGVRMGKLGGAHHVGMGVDPEHAERSAILLVQIGDWREIDQAVSAQCDDAVGTVFPDGDPRRPRLRKKDRSRFDAALNARISTIEFGDAHRFLGSVVRRRQPAQQLGTKAIGGFIPALPLGHVQSECCSCFLHNSALILLSHIVRR
jgi:hypothetical protein